MRLLRLFALLFLFANALVNISFAQTPMQVVKADGYEIPVYNFNNLEPILNRANDTLYVYNFWATWCIPCVEEMPAFLQLDSAIREQPVKLVLVSMDSKSKLESHLTPFLKKNNVKAQVVVLSDPDANAWIDKVSPDWSGTIPATLFVHGKNKTFMERTFTYPELYQTVLDIKKQQ